MQVYKFILSPLFFSEFITNQEYKIWLLIYELAHIHETNCKSYKSNISSKNMKPIVNCIIEMKVTVHLMTRR
jgi:hypothetical protein